jgi:transposase
VDTRPQTQKPQLNANSADRRPRLSLIANRYIARSQTAKLGDRPHADPFHVTKLANTKLDECRRRVQNETVGHRGRKSDPLYRCRRLLTKADERLDEQGRTRLLGLLDAGDPQGEVRTAWHAKEVVRSIYDHHDPDLAVEFVERLGYDLQDRSCPIEIRSLGRTLLRWKDQIAAWHTAQVSQGPTEGINNLIKRVKRAAFGMTRFRNFRIRVLLYAGKPNWALLPGVTPRWGGMTLQPRRAYAAGVTATL